MKDIIVRRLLNVKWSLAVMAVFSFFLAFYVFMTAPQGGAGMFPFTPENGLPGTVEQLPAFLIVFGALSFIGSFVSKSTWVLGFVEPVMGLAMFLVGFWILFFPYGFIAAPAQTWGAVGVFLALYVLFISLEVDRKRAGLWPGELALAIAMLVVAFANLFGFGGNAGAQGLAALSLFMGGIGFLYGAVRLTGVAPSRRAVRERAMKELEHVAA